MSLGMRRHRLDGLEHDNVLAFLALLGLLRALEASDRDRPRPEQLRPRSVWDTSGPPLRPALLVEDELTQSEVAERAVAGIEILAKSHHFDGRKDLNHPRAGCRELLGKAVGDVGAEGRDRIDLLAALMSDAAIKDDKEETVDPTPLCLLFGQGHQHFLDRLAKVPHDPSPPARGRGKKAVAISASECLEEALFNPWHRSDQTFSFRWDPDEDVRYALMPGDPTDGAYKPGTQHGANRLAAVGLAALTIAPVGRASRVRPAVIGGRFERQGFSFAWPIWREPASLAAVRALLSHPELRSPGALDHLGVEDVYVARRISVGKFMNFSRARPLEPGVLLPQ